MVLPHVGSEADQCDQNLSRGGARPSMTGRTVLHTSLSPPQWRRKESAVIWTDGANQGKIGCLEASERGRGAASSSSQSTGAKGRVVTKAFDSIKV